MQILNYQNCSFNFSKIIQMWILLRIQKLCHCKADMYNKILYTWEKYFKYDILIIIYKLFKKF